MRAAVAACLLLALSACAAASPWRDGRDMEGNVYPPECQQDLSWVQAQVYRLPRQQVTDAAWAAMLFQSRVLGKPLNLKLLVFDVNGYYHTASGTIAIADDMTGWHYEDTLHHERCHAIAGDWHE